MSSKEGVKDAKKDVAKDSKNDRISSIPNLVRDPTSRRYLPTSKIGSGGFASVWRAKVADSKIPPGYPECALKVVRTSIKSSQLRQRFRFELGIHNKLSHPNIVAFYRAFAYEDLTYVSLELCEHGSLTDVVKRRRFLTMPEIRRYTIQLSGAIAYLHGRDVVHRDIKAGNVFLDANMNVKLGDFGLATCLEPSVQEMGAFHRRTTFCGTPNYLAPELLSRRGHAAGVDIWALGILIYYLAVGAAPFHSKSKEEIYDRVRKQDYAWPEPSPDSNNIPNELRNLVASVLVPEEQRPSLLEIARHSFFSQGYVPERIDSLSRSRRPRWSRSSNAEGPNDVPLNQESMSPWATKSRLTYDSLMRLSFQVDEPAQESVLLSVQRELESGEVPEVPLRGGVVIQAFASQPAPVATAPPKRKRTNKRDEARPRPQHEIRLDADAGLPSEDEKSLEAKGALPSRAVAPDVSSNKRAPFRALMQTSGNKVRATVRQLDSKMAPIVTPPSLAEEVKPLAARPRTLRSASAKQREAMLFDAGLIRISGRVHEGI